MRLVRVHEASKRVRLRIDPPCNSEEMAALADRIARIAGVAHVLGRPNTGSVILTLADDPEVVLAAIEAAGIARIETAAKQPPIGQVMTLGMLQLDMNIKKHSENAFDLRSSLVVLLLGAAIFQATRGRIAGPASTLALSAFSLLDTGRR